MSYIGHVSVSVAVCTCPVTKRLCREVIRPPARSTTASAGCQMPRHLCPIQPRCSPNYLLRLTLSRAASKTAQPSTKRCDRKVSRAGPPKASLGSVLWLTQTRHEKLLWYLAYVGIRPAAKNSSLCPNSRQQLENTPDAAKILNKGLEQGEQAEA
jgi:hypothetical protein